MIAGHGDEIAEAYLARTRTAERVLYLDFDGVVHHEAVYISKARGIYIDELEAPGRTLFEWVNILESALGAHEDVAIVLSTSWVRRPGFSKAKSRLPESLAARVIGATFHSRVHGAWEWSLNQFLAMPRGLQVLEDARRRQPKHWMALDDDIEDWPSECQENLIACNGQQGISEVVTQRRLRDWLAQTAPAPQRTIRAKP